MTRTVLVALCAVGLTAGPVLAQGATSPAALPLEFIDALMPARSYLNRMGEYRPGELSPHLPPGVANGAAVIGAIVWPDQSRTAILLPEEPAAARARVEARLLAAGFSRRVVEDDRRGFLAPPSADREAGYCSPADDQVTVEALPTQAGSRVVMEVIGAMDGRSCSSTRPSAPGPSSGLPHLLPTLRLPDGVRMDGHSGGTGAGGGGWSATSQASAIGAVAADAMLQHFRPQWQEQGWTLRTESGDATAGIQVWERQQPDGGPLLGSVTVVRASAEELILRLTVQSRAR